MKVVWAVFWKWLLLVTAFSVLMAVLAYCGQRITMTSVWLAEHRRYIIARDERWEPFLYRIEAHLKAQDGDSLEIRRNQKLILDAIAKMGNTHDR